MSSKDSPPSFDPVHAIDISSTTESKITKVSLYSGRAEVTRLYKLSVRTGQNQVKINELPNAIDHNSLRIEGRGAATIQGVTLARTPRRDVVSTSETLTDLLKQKLLAEKALARCQRAISSLQEYLSSVRTDRIPPEQLGPALRSCEAEGEQLDVKFVELSEKIKSLDESIQAERDRLSGSVKENDKLGMTANVGVFATKEGDAELTLIYAVNYASWHAGYDVRVNMLASDKPVTLVYKAIISQSTGEDWKDVPLTLETVTPTYGTHIPVLRPWTLSVYRPKPIQSRNSLLDTSMMRALPRGLPSASMAAPASVPAPPPPPPPLPTMQISQASISSQGSLNTTFQVPGLINIPSDGESHNVTITELALDAKMSWITVPKLDNRVHLKAKVKNASDYTLLPGEASIYVDGSFIAKSQVPSVSPEESFDCSLGIDSALRVTYHPLSKNASQSGFMSKVNKCTYVQRISVFNAKTQPVTDLKIVHNVPVSEDTLISVKLVTPSLSTPSTSTISSSSGNSSGKSKDADSKPLMRPVKVSDGVVAQWDGADDPEGDVLSLGKDGQFNWLCTVPPQGTVNVAVQWEVQYPLDITVTGL